MWGYLQWCLWRWQPHCMFTHVLSVCSPWMFNGWHQPLNPNHCWCRSGRFDFHCCDCIRDWSTKDLCWISDTVMQLKSQNQIQGTPSLFLDHCKIPWVIAIGYWLLATGVQIILSLWPINPSSLILQPHTKPEDTVAFQDHGFTLLISLSVWITFVWVCALRIVLVFVFFLLHVFLPLLLSELLNAN